MNTKNKKRNSDKLSEILENCPQAVDMTGKSGSPKAFQIVGGPGKIDEKKLKSKKPESEWDEVSVLFKFGPGGNEKTFFTESPEKLPVPIGAQKWVSTDGWRGYTDWEYLPGYKEIASGWVTNFPDETTERKVDLANYFDNLSEEKLIPPVDIWWIFGITSNLFSTVSSIVCREEDVETIREWLREICGGREHLQEMLS